MQGVKANDLAIKALKPRPREYEVAVREHRGLVVVVYPSSTKSFALRFRQDGILKRVRLNAPTLAQARSEWQAQRDLLKTGEDPSEKIRSARVDKQLKRHSARIETTIEKLIEDFIKNYAKPNKKSWKSDEQKLKADILPKWGRLKAKDIKRGDVKDLLKDVAKRAPVGANRLLAVVRKMFNWAVDEGILEYSPCARMTRQAPEKSRDRVLSDDEIRTLWNGLAKIDLSVASQLALKLQLVTAVRIGEATGATRKEFDLKRKEWLIPGARTKNGLEHLVPLSPLALEIVSSIGGDSEVLFPGERDGNSLRVDVISHDVPYLREELGMDHFTSHDLRRTAATHLGELEFPPHIINAVLNHKDRTVGAIYNRYKYAKEKRLALEAWARKLLKIVNEKDSKAAPKRSRRGTE